MTERELNKKKSSMDLDRGGAALPERKIYKHYKPLCQVDQILLGGRPIGGRLF